jgi:hypothetical protein
VLASSLRWRRGVSSMDVRLIVRPCMREITTELYKHLRNFVSQTVTIE